MGDVLQVEGPMPMPMPMSGSGSGSGSVLAYLWDLRVLGNTMMRRCLPRMRSRGRVSMEQVHCMAEH